MEDLRNELGKANAATTRMGVAISEIGTSDAEIAQDITDLLTANPGVPEDFRNSLKEHVVTLEGHATTLESTAAALKNTAAKYPPVGPTE